MSTRTVKVVAGAAGCREAARSRGVAVMVDALRASATITSLIEAGARRVWVTTQVQQARKMSVRLGGALLVGERHGFPPPGFDASNSPRAVARLAVRGRDVVFTSTTGAARLGQLEGAALALVGSTVNARYVAAAVAARRGAGRPVFAIAAGLGGRLGGTEEDWIGAALIAERLARLGYRWLERDRGCGRHWPEALDPHSVREGFFAGGHGRSLVQKGLGADVADCSRIDWLEAVAGVVGYARIDRGPPVAELARFG